MRSARANLDWRAYAAVFAITVAVTALHHLLEPGVKVALLFDGRHYFESCQHVTALILAIVGMKPDAVVAAEQALRQYIMLDGPVLPALFGTVYAMLGRVPTSADWTVLVWVQTVLHAAATVLVCKITFQMTRKSSVAFVCSALWAFYPAAVIASGRLMTESLAVVLLLSLPLALRGAIGSKDEESAKAKPVSTIEKLSQLMEANHYGLVAGVVSGLLILLKPGMIPSVVLCWLTCLTMTRTRIAVAVSLALGAGLALSPWMLYTKQTTGKAAITVQRMPVHNALIGWDPETSGWQTNPPSGFEQVMNTGGEPLTTIEGIWMSHPVRCVEILLEKFGHLYSTPWNDYRARVFGLDGHTQGLYHYLLLFLGLTGAFSCLLTAERTNKLALLCASAAIGQFVYLMFEPVCRYSFPQIVFAAVLASFALKKSCRPKRNWKTLAIAAVLSIVSLELITQSEVWSDKQLAEVAIKLKAGEKAGSVITINRDNLKDIDVAMLLVDGDIGLESAQVEINGQKCQGNLLPFNYYDSQKYQSFNLLKELAYGLNVNVDEFRMWRAISVPPDLAKDGRIEISIIPALSGCTIYGDKTDTRNYLSPDFLCVNRLINSKSSMEMRNDSPILAGQSRHTWTTPSKRDGVISPRFKFLIARSSTKAEQASSQGGSIATSNDKRSEVPFAKALSPSDFDENLRSSESTVKISKSILKAARTTGVVIPTPTFQNARNVSISLEGESRATGKVGKVGIVVETITDNHHETFLARLPSSIPTATQWSRFEIKDITPTVTRQGRLAAISVALFPGPWQMVAGYGADRSCTDTELRNLKLTVRPIDIPSLSDKQISIY